MPDEMDELLQQLDYLEGRVKVPSKDPYKEELKDSLSIEEGERDLDSIVKEFHKDLEGMLDSIGSYRETLSKVKSSM